MEYAAIVHFAHRVRWVAFMACWCALVSEAGAKSQEFRFEKPDAKSVGLAGEFNSWKAQPMTKGSDGVWKTTVTLSPGTYGYKFLVNENDWLLDPSTTKKKTVDGVENSAVEVGEGSSSSILSSFTPRPTPTSTPVASALSTPPRSSLLATPSFARGASATDKGAVAAPVTITPKPGDVIEFDAPLSAKNRAAAMRGGNPDAESAMVMLGVPAGFDPARSYPLLVISATVDMPNSSLFPRYAHEAIDGGWVVMAADVPGKAKQDHNDWRWASISAAMEALEANFPGAKTWPVACAGFSGGAKRTGFIAGLFAAKTQHRVIGMLMGGCNQDMATMALREYHPPAYAFEQVPIYLSSGTTDTIATPAHHQYVLRSMKGSGFQKVRLETYAGAHDPYGPHNTEALAWFLAEAEKSAPKPSATSSFDSFFKKP